MGIRGLTGFLSRHPKCPKSQMLYYDSKITVNDNQCEKLNVIMDGNGFVHYVMDNFNDWIPPEKRLIYHSGSCLFKDVVKFYYKMFSLAFNITMIFDSGLPASKLETIFERDSERLKDLITYNSEFLKGSTKERPRNLPPLLYPSVFDALRELGAPHQFAIEEADELIAALAYSNEAFVISNDSDFYVHNIKGYIPLNSLRIQFLDKSVWREKLEISRLISMEAKIFSCKSISSTFRFYDTNSFALTCSLAGNEVVPHYILDKVINKQRQILAHLGRNSNSRMPRSLKDKIHTLFYLFGSDKLKQDDILDILKNVCRLNLYELTHITDSVKLYSPNSVRTLNVDPTIWTSEKKSYPEELWIRSGFLLGRFCEIALLQYCRLCAGIEDISFESAFLTTNQIRKWIFFFSRNNLFHFESETILQSRRSHEKFIKEKIVIPKELEFLKICGHSLKEFNSLNFEGKFECFFKLLGISQVTKIQQAVILYCETLPWFAEHTNLSEIIEKSASKVSPDDFELKKHSSQEVLKLFHTSTEIQAITLEISNLFRSIFCPRSKEQNYTPSQVDILNEFLFNISNQFDAASFILTSLKIDFAASDVVRFNLSGTLSAADYLKAIVQ
eukprot:NODE_49_length_31687_cov_0.791123.p8 type:complete len:616 gc:universal NODE_49_length_31687_cov_0.791123:4359-2512(-)